MTIEQFLKTYPTEVEQRSTSSSYRLVLTEWGASIAEIQSARVFPEVPGYQFPWGIIKEYRVNNTVIWNVHLSRLREKFKEHHRDGCEMVMRCLAYFDLDYWADGTPFWGPKDVNLFWGRRIDRPPVELGAHAIPDYLDIGHGTETEALSLSCHRRDETRARTWIGKVFVPIILVEMIEKVEASL